MQPQKNSKFEWKDWNCPICMRSKKSELGFRGGIHYRFGQGETARVVKCESCGLLFCDPFPIPLSFQEIYGDPDSYFGDHDRQKKLACGEEFLRDFITPHFPLTARILDIGAGLGEFVKVCRDSGFTDTQGIEPSLATAEKARELFQLELITDATDIYAKKNPQSFDLIFMHSVLEHVTDPNLLVASAAELLRREGKLFIELPRDPNLLTIVGNLWEKWKGSKTVYNLSPTWGAYHVYGFTPDSLKTLLEKNGFEIEVIRVFSTAQIPAGKGWRGKLAAIVANLLQTAANYLGLASNMTVWAKKMNHRINFDSLKN